MGLMPLPEDDWTLGKCALKALLYMASGVPAVCSAVGEVTKIIDDGVNGFLARTEEDWYRILDTLLRDRSLGERVAAEARRMVVDRFSVSAAAFRLFDVLELLLEEGAVE